MRAEALFLKEAVKYNVLPIDDRGVERFDPTMAGRPDLMAGTSAAFSLRATRIARLSRVNSSMMHNIWNAFPSWVRSATKS